MTDHIQEAYLGITSALEGPGNADFEDLSLIRDHIDLARADLAAEREKCDAVSCDLAAERLEVGRLEFRLEGLDDDLTAEREKVRVLREALDRICQMSIDDNEEHHFSEAFEIPFEVARDILAATEPGKTDD